MSGLHGIQGASFCRIGLKASVRSRRLTTIGLSRRFLAGSNAAADNYRIGNARSSFHGGLSRTRVQLPPPPPLHPFTNKRLANYINFLYRRFGRRYKNRVVIHLHPSHGRLSEEVGSVLETMSMPEVDSGNVE